MQQKSGFILIIVLGVLGVLAYLALSLAEKSHLARTLSRGYLLESQTKLVARSGIEKGKQWILRPFLDAGASSQAEPMSGTVLPVILPLDGLLTASVRVDDASGRICLNDGMKAGQAELKGAYNPQALDPWPVPAPPLPPTPRTQDVSAWINMRLRSLLNAYGDVQRFAAFQLPSSQSTQGWPEWQGASTEPTYNNAVVFNHTATDTADRFISIPPRLIDGTQTTPEGSAGLGDRIIGARPVKGYTDVEQIRNILNQWWADHKPVGHVETDFFARVSSDFTATAWHDNAFWRMKREFGGNHAVYTNQADYQSDATSPLPGTMVEIEANPPDFTDIWKPHPVPPINLNAASDAVRAAVFHAPVNISLVCEGRTKDTVNWGPPFGYNIGIDSERPTLGVGAPLVFAGMMENGRGVNSAGSTLLTQWQRNRLLSVRDAMICSQAYRAVAQAPGVGWPDSFERFAWHLKRFLINGGYQVRAIERAWQSASTYGQPSDIDMGFSIYVAGPPGNPGGTITQWVLAEFYPHILSCQRRLPAWMGAPVALLSPWRRHGAGNDFLRSAEDFVFRSPHPKVTFQPTGVCPLVSTAFLQRGSMNCRRRITAVVQAYETTVLRDQASFRAANDLAATSPDILIGPEPGNLSSPFLGTVGLRDRGEVIPGGTRLNDGGPVLGTRYDFTGGFKRHPSSSFGHMTLPASDPDAVTGNGVSPGFGHEELQASSMEGAATSIFPRAGADASDMSPFGGVFFSSFNHGRLASRPFGDSFYFRPDTFLIAPTGFTGTWGNSGLISLWYRKPTGYVRDVTLMHMTLWERVTARLSMPPGPVEERLRPINFHLRTANNGDYVYFDVSTGNNGATSNGPAGVPDSGYYLQPWPQLNAMPLPTSQADYTNSTVFRSMMPPWMEGLFNSFWQTNLLINAGYSGAHEEGSSSSTIRAAGSSRAYVHRAGAWVRLVARWDFSKLAFASCKTELITHIHPPSFIFSNAFGRTSGLMNPKMVMSFGERQYQVMPALSSSFVAPLGSLLPVNRLNSCIDNIVVQFGGFPHTDFETVPPNTSTTETQVYNATQAIPGFDSRRYNIRPAGAQPLSEPAWVINPKLPSGSKILQFGARIYDVPFYPEFGPPGHAMFGTWLVLAPRVDLSVAQGVTVAAPTRSALPIIDQGIAIHSNSWSSYPLKSSENARFRLTYRSVDAMDKPLTADVLTDIPWIQELNWMWVPSSGMRILSWKEE